MVRAIVFGATGYTGLELIRLLAGHPETQIVAGSSRDWAGRKASDAFPFVTKTTDFHLFELSHLLENPNADVAFLALPHGESALTASSLLDAGIKVIDLSADSRLKDLAVYEKWYGTHHCPSILAKAVYGLPEIKRSLIRTADLVANPGCYPSTVIIGLAPIMNCDEVDTDCPIVDSKSGISGAGRGAKLNTSFCESGEGFKPYGVIRHRHIPEMEQELSELSGKPVKIRFTPHLIPVSRGMVSTIYLPLKDEINAAHMRDIYCSYYEQEPFINILPPGTYPDTARLKGSNQCHIALEIDERTGIAVVMVGIDNLVKGASGVAVQNMNLMMGLEETCGLLGLPLFP